MEFFSENWFVWENWKTYPPLLSKQRRFISRNSRYCYLYTIKFVHERRLYLTTITDCFSFLYFVLCIYFVTRKTLYDTEPGSVIFFSPGVLSKETKSIYETGWTSTVRMEYEIYFVSSMYKICIVRNVLFLLSMIDKIRRISVYWYFDRYSIDILFLLYISLSHLIRRKESSRVKSHKARICI